MIFTDEQLLEGIHELTGQKWVTAETVKKLTKREFRYLDILIHQTGTESKVYSILAMAYKRISPEEKNLIDLRKADDKRDCGLTDEQIDYLYN